MSIVNPFLGHRVSGLWTPAHQAVDYATPIGFRFVAPADGVYYRMPDELTRTPGQAGRWGRLVLDDGRSITFCHLNRHFAHHGQRVTGGRTVLAETGNTGYVTPAPTRAQPWLGAHMHTYGLSASGRRWNWTLAAAPASVDPPKPLPTPDTQPEPAPLPEEEEYTMATTIIVERSNPALAKGILDVRTGKLARELNGAAESAVWREIEITRPDLVEFVQVSDAHYAALKG